MDYTRLKIKYCPAIFPNVDFEDRIYNYDTRKIQDPSADITVVKTNELFNVVGEENISAQVMIQSRYYNAFELILYAKETTNYNILKIGEQIILVDESGYSYFVELLEFNVEKINETFNYKFTVKFREKTIDSLSISNYCQSDYLLEKYNRNELVMLELSPNPNVYKDNGTPGNPDVSNTSYHEFYTKILPIMDRDDANIQSITLGNGRIVNTNSQDYGYFKLRFWLSILELNKFKKLATRCFRYQNGSTLGEKLYFNGSIYTSVKPLEYEVKTEELVNLAQVDVKFYYEHVNYNNFS
jgi:hypothetical protein